ncbi:UPF0483 protein [Escovopsis weberi]|uniref:UPF0483 protein n=1 Tax=Escovopsis weberi TaxID=150374 RepID=A0A0M9VWN0_ESCWE|nr:UPF0483 protein [Escovopsis weberi]
MRFLCLHGRGTNAAIFKDQTAKICDAIGQDNDFVYIDGHVAADVVPGIGSITASRESDRFAFVPLGADPHVYRAFFAELRDFIEFQGPFDGLMGFSEGASIAMTMLAEDARRPYAHFKLFCASSTQIPAER